MDREPLGRIAIPAAAIVTLLALVGLHVTSDQVDAVSTVITAAGPLLSALIVWWRGRQKTTPLDSPRSAAGEDLVPASTTTLLPGPGND